MAGIVEVKEAKVTVAGKEFIDLNNVEFVGNNDEYRQLLQLIKKTRKLLAVTEVSDPDYSREFGIRKNKRNLETTNKGEYE